MQRSSSTLESVTNADPEVEAVLVQSLGNLGRAVNRRRGATWAAKRLKTDGIAETRAFDPQRSQELLAQLSHILGRAPEYQAPGDLPMLRAVVGSGSRGMNPTYVRVYVDPARGSVRIEAFAKEGPIKQRSAAKAVQRVLTELRL
jgi:hypothetical protein